MKIIDRSLEMPRVRKAVKLYLVSNLSQKECAEYFGIEDALLRYYYSNRRFMDSLRQEMKEDKEEEEKRKIKVPENIEKSNITNNNEDENINIRSEKSEKIIFPMKSDNNEEAEKKYMQQKFFNNIFIKKGPSRIQTIRDARANKNIHEGRKNRTYEDIDNLVENLNIHDEMKREDLKNDDVLKIIDSITSSTRRNKIMGKKVNPADIYGGSARALGKMRFPQDDKEKEKRKEKREKEKKEKSSDIAIDLNPELKAAPKRGRPPHKRTTLEEIRAMSRSMSASSFGSNGSKNSKEYTKKDSNINISDFFTKPRKLDI